MISNKVCVISGCLSIIVISAFCMRLTPHRKGETSDALVSPVFRELPVPIENYFSSRPIELPNGSPEELNRLSLKFVPSHRVPSPSFLLHYLYLWGPDVLFEQSGSPSGPDMVRLLLDGDRHRLYSPRDPLAYRDTFGRLRLSASGSSNSEAHVDQTLSLVGDLGIPLHRSIKLRSGSGMLSEALKSSVADFVSGQELEWSLAAYARYLDGERLWKNQWGDAFTFDAMVGKLLERKFSDGACEGTHALQTMCIILQVNKRYAIISEETRQLILDRVKTAAQILSENQHPDGCWSPTWSDTSLGKFTWYPPEEIHTIFLTTGHHLEWIKIAPPEAIPSKSCIQRAVFWCYHNLAAITSEEIAKDPCPYVHCLKVIYQIAYPSLLRNGYLPAPFQSQGEVLQP